MNENLQYPLSMIQDDEYKACIEETATAGVIYLGRNHKIRNVNEKAEQICCIKRGQVIGRSPEMVFSGFGEKFLEFFSAAQGQEVQSDTVKTHIQGQQVYLHINVLKLFDADGAMAGNILILQDVSAVRATLKQIQTTKLLMSLGELAAGVAHHVRTPLTTISGYLQLMLARAEDDKYTVKRSVLEGLLNEVSYINDVVKELVMFAKPSVVKRPGADINRIANEALLMTFRDLGHDKIRIDRQIMKGLPTISGDANLLQQALVNIFQNAFEAMGQDGVLTVKTWRDFDINMLVVSIADTGAGIAQEILPRVFEPFYTTKIDRMGLGLPVAYRIVSEHGGFIHLALPPYGATGTKVQVYLPILDVKRTHLSVVQQQVLNLQ